MIIRYTQPINYKFLLCLNETLIQIIFTKLTRNGIHNLKLNTYSIHNAYYIF